MSDLKQKFRGLLQRPYEPLFLPKSNGSVIFNLPENFYTDRYRAIGSNLACRFGPESDRSRLDTDEALTVVSFGAVDDNLHISFAESIPRNGSFSLFNPHHRRIAGQLIKLFMEQPSADRLGDVSAYLRDRLNGPLYQYALSVALQHREDTADIPVPSFLHLFPDLFIDAAAFPRLREEGRAVLDENRMAIEVPANFTATDEEPEQRLAYFREDLGASLHHWHWHLVYPGEGPLSIVKKDRRGELLYYMHNQLLNRYKVERFSQGLPRVVSITSLRQPIPEGYYPKLIRSSNNSAFPARYPNMQLSDLRRAQDQLYISIADVEQQIIRVVEAIDKGAALSESGEEIPLNNVKGIDTVVNIFESNALSINRPFYGDAHNSGHLLIGFIHDPTGRFLESNGVMADFATAMRDPTFYRWHGYVDDVCRRHKERFAPYTFLELWNPNIRIMSFDTKIESKKGPTNTLLTFWQRSQVDLGTGLDFAPKGNLSITFTHLQHAPFNYRFQINNSGPDKFGTIRIFLAPKVDEKGVRIPFDEQCRTVIELDKFRVTLRPGVNNIIRKSASSSVTIPYERTFRNVAESNVDGTDAFRFCNCGWPSHMLLPKGDPNGVEYDLFAMVSNYEQDRVSVNFDESKECDDAHSYCGLRGRLYPDARNMGYPFDRKLPRDVGSLMEFVAPYANMRLATVRIRFTNTVINKT